MMVRSLLLASVVFSWPAFAGDLALKRVMLSSGGVGYVEYEASVDGPASLTLDVPLAQVDDVLTSLVVFDTAGGVGGLELPGRDTYGGPGFSPAPFGPDALASPLAYLNSLQGVTLEVAGPQAMTGRLLRAEEVSDGTDVRRTRVSLLTDSGLRQFVLEDAESVQVVNPALRDRISAALANLRREASQSARHLTLYDSGSGKRVVRVGYVVSMPLWKASYRLVLPTRDGETARLQGWAVLENATGADWNSVQLTLQYGNPVTLHQAIYQSYFLPRPEVPVAVLGRLLPDVDTRAFAAAPSLGKSPAPVLPPASLPPAPSQAGVAIPSAARMAEIAPPAEQTSAAEGAQDTVFRLPAPVMLAAGHTASVPILDRTVPASRVGLVQLDRPHPLAAVRLSNDTGSSLPAGLLTLYDPASAASFAGDARLGGLPTGENRLLSFSEDLRTAVTWQIDHGTSLTAVTAADGVLRVDRRRRWTARIGLVAPPAEARNLLIEIPKSLGTELAVDDGAKPAEETAAAWRLAVALKPGETRNVVAHVDRLERQQISLLQGDSALAVLLTDTSLTPAAHAALQKVADLHAAEVARQAERDRLGSQVAQTEQDEDRVRKNLAVAQGNDALHARLVRQIDADEDRLASLSKAVQAADAAIDQAHQSLSAAISAIRL